jgi:hypothetical protein
MQLHPSIKLFIRRFGVPSFDSRYPGEKIMFTKRRFFALVFFLSGIGVVANLSAQPSVLPSPITSGTVKSESESSTINKSLTRLREERETLEKERQGANRDLDAPPDNSASERAKLRIQLLDLMKKIAEKKKEESIPEKKTPSKEILKQPNKIDFNETTKPNNKLGLAKNLYRLTDYDGSLRAFRLIDTETLQPEESAFVKYMIGCCLRQLGKAEEAMAIYREVANAAEDEFITECALWQIGSIRYRAELETQLEELRARRKSP